MPLVRISMPQSVSQEKKLKVMADLSKSLSRLTGKPEQYMMIVLEPPCDILFGGSAEPSAFVEIKSIGALDGERTKSISEEFCAYFSSQLGIPAARVYIEFRDVAPAHWGWDSRTFG